MSPTTSFLIPVWNAESTIASAIHSACDQSVRDHEVVVVDDGSSDDTLQIVRSIVDPRVQVVTTPHRGLVAALNIGVSHCKGRYIARLDADDIATPDRLERQIPYLEADPSIGVVDSHVHFTRDEEAVPGGMQRYADWINQLNHGGDIDRELLVESPMVHPAATIRASALHGLQGYRHGDFPEDYDLWLRMRRRGWRLSRVPRVLVHMRDHDERLTRTDARYARAAFRMLKQAFLGEGPLRVRREVAVWGAGKSGKPWIRWLQERGHTIPCVVDIAQRGTRRGVPICPPSALRTTTATACVVAVGAAGARPVIREAMSRLRPQWTEGVDWWAVC